MATKTTGSDATKITEDKEVKKSKKEEKEVKETEEEKELAPHERHPHVYVRGIDYAK